MDETDLAVVSPSTAPSGSTLPADSEVPDSVHEELRSASFNSLGEVPPSTEHPHAPSFFPAFGPSGNGRKWMYLSWHLPSGIVHQSRT